MTPAKRPYGGKTAANHRSSRQGLARILSSAATCLDGIDTDPAWSPRQGACEAAGWGIPAEPLNGRVQELRDYVVYAGGFCGRGEVDFACVRLIARCLLSLAFEHLKDM